MNLFSSRTNVFWLLNLFYLLLMVALIPVSGNNPRSRLALEASLCEGLVQKKINYSINIQQQNQPAWTIDWAQTPDGNFYSNKAPGPSFLAMLVHCPIYWAGLSSASTPEERIKSHHKQLYFVEIMNSLFLQILPLLFFSYFFLKKQDNKSASSQLFFVLSLYFGSTAAIYMNSWFGHGLSALFFTFAFCSFVKKSYLFLGFFLSWALLCDYALAITLVPIALVILWTERKQNLGSKALMIFRIALGALPAAFLWIDYHKKSFGSFLRLPQNFQNPLFLDNPDAQGSLRAVFGALPNFYVMGELLFGVKRGILVTQPWILVLIVFAIFLWNRFEPNLKTAFAFVVSSFLALLLMNATFGQWHAGSSAGPRYLSASLLTFSVLAFWIWEKLSSTQRLILWFSLIPSLALFVLAQSSSIIPQPDPLWPALINIATEKLGTFSLRASLLIVFLTISIGVSWRRLKALEILKA